MKCIIKISGKIAWVFSTVVVFSLYILPLAHLQADEVTILTQALNHEDQPQGQHVVAGVVETGRFEHIAPVEGKTAAGERQETNDVKQAGENMPESLEGG